MLTDHRKTFGKLRILLESNREYFNYFQQIRMDSKDYLCREQTQTSLGQHLLDFLESNKTVFQKACIRYHSIDDYLTRDYQDFDKIQYYLDFINSLYQDLADTNIIWKSVVFNSPVLFHHRWYCFYATKEYLLDSASVGEEVRLEKMRLYWEQTRKAILDEIRLFDTISSFITSMNNAVTFCLDNSAFPEQSDLHPGRRTYLYQTLFDTRFLLNDSMKVYLNLSEKKSIIPDVTLERLSQPVSPVEQLNQRTFSTKDYFHLFQNADSRKAYTKYLEKVQKQEIELSLNLNIQTVEDVYTACIYSFFTLVSKNIHVRRCRYCNRYFSPYNRSDELYCSRIWEKNKSCRELYHEKKLKADELTQYYRKAYKKHNTKKQRNLKNKPSSEKNFKKWASMAKKALEQAKNNEITFEEFKKILNSSEYD